jgi:sulfide dehydrogenase [flavocytochrome c] flavoprotein chain
MTHTQFHSALSRRHVLGIAAGGLAASLLPGAGWADDDKTSSGTAATIALANTGLQGKRVVVIGGGMAGMSVAKYLRLWGGSGLAVTLVEPDALYVSNIMSNLVLNGSRNVASLQFARDALTSKYGVVRKAASLKTVNVAAHTVTLSDNTTLPYDRLVLAPGVRFEDAYGLTQADYDSRTPHAWRAGPQTTLLAQQIAAMANGDTFVMTIPKAPYRCPPGPYERACVVADYLKRTKGPNARVLVLDENPVIQAERHTFETAFNQIHAGTIRYESGVSHIAIQPATRSLTYSDAVGTTQWVQARVINPIAPHRAEGSQLGGWMAAAGLNNSDDGRWAKVNVLNYASTAPGAGEIHVIGDAASCGLPKAGHVANQEAKICADAIVRAFLGTPPDPAPVANSACYSPITASTASWLTAVYQYDPTDGKMKVASNGGKLVVNGQMSTATESAVIDSDNFKDMGTWFKTLMQDTTA